MNGDFANKIGTYSVAALAKIHNIPFHPVAPMSTVDFRCEDGDAIPIEEREGNDIFYLSSFSLSLMLMASRL